ncbi:MAG: hypothetical protein AAF959_20740, partial [Cyanobacteria bacterium P01_D01_bin.56]
VWVRLSEIKTSIKASIKLLEKIAPERLNYIDALIDVFISDKEGSYFITDTFMQVSDVRKLCKILIELKPYLQPEISKNNYSMYHDTYKVLWHCAQNMTYPNFFNAWYAVT